MSGLKPGDRALVIPHIADRGGLGGHEVTLIRITNDYPRSTEMWGTIWEVSLNGILCMVAEMILQKIDPPKNTDTEDTDTPDMMVSWDSCPWKPNPDYVRNWEYKETT